MLKALQMPGKPSQSIKVYLMWNNLKQYFYVKTRDTYKIECYICTNIINNAFQRNFKLAAQHFELYVKPLGGLQFS